MDEEKNDGFDTRQINILIERKRNEKIKLRMISIALACAFGLGIVGAALAVYIDSHVKKDTDLSI